LADRDSHETEEVANVVPNEVRASPVNRRKARQICDRASEEKWRFEMIHVTRLNRVQLVINSDLIEHIEVTPDTVITLTTGQKIMVLESAEEIVNRVIEYRRKLNSWPDTEMSATETSL
jgi:flagellar protein FlbD